MNIDCVCVCVYLNNKQENGNTVYCFKGTRSKYVSMIPNIEKPKKIKK